MTLPSKADIRALALARRDALGDIARIEASLALVDHYPFGEIPVAGRIVAGFLPIRSEIDARPLMDALRQAGARLALPAFETRDAPMVFRLLERGAPLVPMGFGTVGPGPSAPEVEPDVVLTPLAAFDARGARIGYGKGHYDCALARLDRLRRIKAIGVAFCCQAVEGIPAEPHDRKLDGILTESGFRAF